MSEAWATPDRRALRELARAFVAREVRPHVEAWERDGQLPREVHRKAAAAGLLGIGFPEEVGGSGGDAIDAAIVTEEILAGGGSSGVCAALFTHGIALPHILAAGDAALVERYVRPTLAGERIGCLAITEPDAGSDVAALRTTAHRDGESYVVNGAKTFITSGVRADFLTTAVRTGGAGHAGISLLVIDSDSPGLTATPLAKMGWLCSDTAELSFTDVRVPAARLVGAEHGGFAQLMVHFERERLALAVQAYATADRALALALAWARDRHTFGRPLASRQVIRHRLAEMARQLDVARTYTRSVLAAAVAGEDVGARVAMAKNTSVLACQHVVDEAVQIFGGAGYLRGSEVERHYRDARILGIGGGTTEIMNELIGRSLLP